MKTLESLSLDDLDAVSGGLSLVSLGRVGAPVVYAQTPSYAPTSYAPSLQPQYAQPQYDYAYVDPYAASDLYDRYYEPEYMVAPQQTSAASVAANLFGGLMTGVFGAALGGSRAPATSSSPYTIVEYYE